jgi:hypothetical protein
MAKYKKVTNLITNEEDTVQNTETTAFIPFDPANTDYQEYLEWIEEGNTPEAAD